MAINYNDLVLTVKNLVVDTGGDDFTQILPQAIAYAENRCYRELDFLANRTADTSVTLASGTRSATYAGDISVIEGVNLVSPAGGTLPTGTRISLERASLDLIDSLYGIGSATTGVPEFYALLNDVTLIFAPTPNGAFHTEIIGTFQPAPMSFSNQTTVLGNYFQEMFIAACMIFLTGWQQNFGAQSDNPQMSQSWEGQYMKLKDSALEFIQRQKSQDPNWTPFTPTPLSTPRG